MSNAKTTNAVVDDIGLAFDEVNKYQDEMDTDYFFSTSTTPAPKLGALSKRKAEATRK